jgi:non-homologous end joining protein Ku
MKLITAKAKGIKVKAPHLKVVPAKPTDLTAQLKASLNARKRAS